MKTYYNEDRPWGIKPGESGWVEARIRWRAMMRSHEWIVCARGKYDRTAIIAAWRPVT